MTKQEVELRVGDVVIMNGYLELISDLASGIKAGGDPWVSAGGGFLHQWPGDETYVDFLTAGTRDPTTVIAILGHLEQEEFIAAFVRKWGKNASRDILIANYSKPSQRLTLDLNEDIITANFEQFVTDY